MKIQIGIRSILVLVAMFAVICATYSWLLSKTGYDAFAKMPPLFVPSIRMMEPGILLIPFVCLPLVLAMIGLVMRASPRPYTILVFFAFQFAVFMIDISLWGNGKRETGNGKRDTAYLRYATFLTHRDLGGCLS